MVKLEFGGESPLTMRARCGTFRDCPDPLGIVTAKQLNKLEFGGQFDKNIVGATISRPRAADCRPLQYRLDKLEFG